MQDKINQMYFNKLTKTVTKGHCREKQDKANKKMIIIIKRQTKTQTKQQDKQKVRQRAETKIYIYSGV